MIQWQLCPFSAGEDLRIKFCRRPVCTCKYITQQGFQVTSYRTRAVWDVCYPDNTAKKRWLRHCVLENRVTLPHKRPYVFSPNIPHFVLSISFYMPVSAKLGIGTGVPPSDSWTGAVCFLFQHIVVPCLGTAFTLSTLSTVGKYVWSFYWRL